MAEGLRLRLTTDSDDDRPVFVAGNFNQWLPDEARFRLQRVGYMTYEFQFPADFRLPQPLEYKYTRGSWADAELAADGKIPANRISTRSTGLRRDHVPHWRLGGESFDSRLYPQIHVSPDEFWLPALGRHRRFRVLLPADYDQQPERHYPVLYLLDGQNLMGGGAGFGDWGLERRLAILKARGRGDLIVVALDHGDEFRKSEFNPYNHRWLGPGEGRAFVQALTDTLKPYLDRTYRTRPEREATGIGGSSLGGLLSLYAGLTAWRTFGRVLVFSPSLWVSGRIFGEAERLPDSAQSRFYLYGGGKEGMQLKPALQRLEGIFSARPGTQTKLVYDARGRHQEDFWGREFPKAVEWLFF